MREACARPSIEHAVDLGAGVGAVGLSLLALGAARRVTLVERDPLAAALLRENAAVFGDRATVIEGDVADVTVAADLVVSNPPYFEATRGRSSPDARRESARSGALLPFVSAAARCAHPPALLVVYPSAALAELLRAAEECRLRLQSSRFVHADPASPGRVVVAAFAADVADAPVVLPPWHERDASGAAEAELATFLREGSISSRADGRA